MISMTRSEMERREEKKIEMKKKNKINKKELGRGKREIGCKIII